MSQNTYNIVNKNIDKNILKKNLIKETFISSSTTRIIAGVASILGTIIFVLFMYFVF
jgi:Fe2+ transport system protein B